MEDKKQDVNSLKELVKTADSFRTFFSNLANELSKVLADIKAPVEEEDTWEMKCPYEYGDKHYCIQSSGDVFLDSWHDIEADNSFFSQGNIFPTEEAAELESKRRNLLTRFRAFRDECNGDWQINWNKNEAKYYLYKSNMTDDILCNDIYFYETFSLFGYFKNEQDAERAIELFGDEIIELFVDNEV
jgi:hypothetical protein|nr:MAG TPA: hypothetical protein [Caudoviricetes sp.]